MTDGFLQRINRETANRKTGKPARIVAKMNSLEDRDICRALSCASKAGVPVELLVRGTVDKSGCGADKRNV